MIYIKKIYEMDEITVMVLSGYEWKYIYERKETE